MANQRAIRCKASEGSEHKLYFQISNLFGHKTMNALMEVNTELDLKIFCTVSDCGRVNVTWMTCTRRQSEASLSLGHNIAGSKMKP